MYLTGYNTPVNVYYQSPNGVSIVPPQLVLTGYNVNVSLLNRDSYNFPEYRTILLISGVTEAM